MRRYFGPYKVTRKISDVTYEVETFGNQQGRRKTKYLVHICRMKPYLNPEDQEDHLEEDPEDDSTNFQEEDIPTERTQQPQTRVEISGPITRSRALRLRIRPFQRRVSIQVPHNRVVRCDDLHPQLMSTAYRSERRSRGEACLEIMSDTALFPEECMERRNGREEGRE
ncbi:hypothetical protein LAZ67_6003689 [Cordylochernes scorpioides]|uniref:Integrase p58-like C-terminal domain-containing protein n=1 Tax=Cordylochernes scorpioides TaxID=51811 RepID=A0ABY6KNY6_9ARAC|nr:hypothetical protein LAZ67_6003689 [Cordylochernes scorpioides]